MKTKTIRLWAVLKNGKLIGSGWGTMQAWIFLKRWEAVDALEQDRKDLPKLYKAANLKFTIVPIELVVPIIKK